MAQIALWTMCRFRPDFELYDSEKDAARIAVSIYDSDNDPRGVVMGVQYEDGTVLAREEWPAFQAEYERRESESPAWGSAAAPPARTIRDPFQGNVMHVYGDVPTWVGKR